MYYTQQTPPADEQIRAGYYPPHERVIKLEKMADGITELAAHLDAGTYQLLELICEFDEEEGWAGEGINSCAHWLNWKCGMSLVLLQGDNYGFSAPVGFCRKAQCVVNG